MWGTNKPKTQEVNLSQTLICQFGGSRYFLEKNADFDTLSFTAKNGYSVQI
jgi:hypothetical protein